ILIILVPKSITWCCPQHVRQPSPCISKQKEYSLQEFILLASAPQNLLPPTIPKKGDGRTGGWKWSLGNFELRTAWRKKGNGTEVISLLVSMKKLFNFN